MIRLKSQQLTVQHNLTPKRSGAGENAGKEKYLWAYESPYSNGSGATKQESQKSAIIVEDSGCLLNMGLNTEKQKLKTGREGSAMRSLPCLSFFCFVIYLLMFRAGRKTLPTQCIFGIRYKDG